jgi:phage shock protein PspC (stress-responsive transcriptional regulator)
VAERLYRSPTDRVIAGVAGGLATWLGLDPSLVRVAWVVLAILSGGIFALVYFVMMIVVPLPPPGFVPRPGAGAPIWPAPGGGGAVPGWQSSEPPGWGQSPAGGQAWPPGQPGQPAQPGQPGHPVDPTQTGWTTPVPAWTAPQPKFDAGNAGIIGGAILVLLGAWFLVDRYVDVDWDLLWPVVVIVLGVVLIVGALRRRRPSAD